jgi:hypothetical protein
MEGRKARGKIRMVYVISMNAWMRGNLSLCLTLEAMQIDHFPLVMKGPQEFAH